MYVALVCVVAAAVGGYQHHVNKQFAKSAARAKRADEVSCNNRRILKNNQRLVLQILRRNLEEFIRQYKYSGTTVDYFQRSLALLTKAEENLANTPACADR